ncbi:MAG: OmpA family protein [Elusimicrobiota bacterium]|jgi:peptidoglycan-associated lipoprotein|nr:OmpA family protein [Elusimicrobiota bacterium]
MIRNSKLALCATIVLAVAFFTLGCKPQQKNAVPPAAQQPAPQQETPQSVQTPPDAVPQTPAKTAEAKTENLSLKTVYFDYNQAALTDSAKETLRSNAKFLAKDKRSVTVEGYCDDTGSIAYNAKLGAKRARAVKRYYTRLGISKERISVATLGKHNPVSKKDKSLNRRAETKING